MYLGESSKRIWINIAICGTDQIRVCQSVISKYVELPFINDAGLSRGVWYRS